MSMAALFAKAQEAKLVRLAELQKMIDTPSDEVKVINFWATWCAPCKKELNAINEVYSDWKKETGVKLIAISLDDSKSSSKVAPYVNSKSWEYEEYLDLNSDFKRAMSVNMPPHTFILDGQGNIVRQHVGFKDGDEEQYIEVVRKIVKGEKIEH